MTDNLGWLEIKNNGNLYCFNKNKISCVKIIYKKKNIIIVCDGEEFEIICSPSLTNSFIDELKDKIVGHIGSKDNYIDKIII